MKHRRIKAIVQILGAMLLLSGCAATRNMVGQEYMKETVPNSKTYFSQVRATAGENEFMVSGKIRLKSSSGVNAPDFVKVELVDEGGRVLDSQKVSYYPRILIGRGKHREARFAARFNQVPPSGSVVRLSKVD